MPEIEISGSAWCTPADIYDSLLLALRAPTWHGRNLDALWDSISGGDINEVKPPYRVIITNASELSPECEAMLRKLETLFAEAQTIGVAVEFLRR